MAVTVESHMPLPLGVRFAPSRVALRGFIWGVPIAGMLWLALGGAAALLF